MSQLALDLGVPSTLVTEAVYARCLSALKDARVRASKVLTGPPAKYTGDAKQFIEAGAAGALRLEDLQLRPRLRADCRRPPRSTTGRSNYGNIALLWRGGCIIRAAFLDRIKEAFDADPKLENLLLAPYFTQGRRKGPGRLAARRRHGRASWAFRCRPSPRPCPTTTAIASERLPANLLQAQRDYFGAHTYQRIDKPGTFHTDWICEAPQVAPIGAASASVTSTSRLRSDLDIASEPHMPNDYLEQAVRPLRPGGRRHRRHRRAGRRAVRGHRPGRRDGRRRRPQRRARPGARRRRSRSSAARRRSCRSTSTERESIEDAAGRHAHAARPRRHAGQLRRRQLGQRLPRRQRRRLGPRPRRQPARHALGLPDFRRAHGRRRRRLDPEHRQRHGPPAAVARVRLFAPRRRPS